MAVPASPRLSDVCAEFQVAITTPLSAFLRGAGLVPDTAQNASVPATLPINLSQMVGAVRYVNVTGSASPSSLSSSASSKGTFTIGTITINGQGGNGGYTYSGPTLISGTNSSANASVNSTASGNQFTFRATNANPNTESISGIWRVTVSDGTTSANVDFQVRWN